MEFAVTTSGGPTPIGTITFQWRCDYVSVPILCKMRYEAGSVVPYAFVGSRADFYLGYGGDDDTFSSLYDDFKKLSVGGSVGAGVQIESVLPVAILVEARYNMDFVNSFDNGIVKVSNNSFDLWLGVAF